jgi:HEAT repeat protein
MSCIVDKINQLKVQAQALGEEADWSSLIQYLQQLLVTENLEEPEFDEHREGVLELALSILMVGDFQQRWEIAKVLSSLGKIAIAPLVEIVEDEDADEELRSFAAQILGEIKSPDLIVPLVELFKSDNEELRTMAATALGQMGSVAIPALFELLENEDTRLLAVRSLSYIRHRETITPLLSVVQDSEVAVRLTAIEALGSFHDERIPPVLLNALNDTDASVRREAVLSLGYRPDLCAELDLVAKLQSRLYDSNSDVSCAAVIALSRMKSDSAAYHLFQLLVSPNTLMKIQLDTIHALVWMETLSGLEYLHSALNQLESVRLWQEIVTVLGRVHYPAITDKATAILLNVLQSGHPALKMAATRSAIALSLGQLGNIQALDSLITMLTDQDAQVRWHAIAALKNLASEATYSKLQHLANHATLSPEVHQAVVAVLAEL